MTKLEQVARAICGHSLSGYCFYVGGDVDGCKVGRGESYSGTNCKARIEALEISEEWQLARAAIEAMREPTLAMRKVCSFETAEIEYPAMLRAALTERKDQR